MCHMRRALLLALFVTLTGCATVAEDLGCVEGTYVVCDDYGGCRCQKAPQPEDLESHPTTLTRDTHLSGTSNL